MTEIPGTIWATPGRYPSFDNGWGFGEFTDHDDDAGGIEYTRTDNWRPIETAPKDGTVVFVTDGATRWIAHSPTALLTATKWQPLPALPKEDA